MVSIRNALCVLVALATLILLVDADCCNCCKRKHKRRRCPQPISTSEETTTPPELITPTSVPCNCDPEKCAKMTYEYCLCQHDDPDQTVSNPSLPQRGNCSDLNVPCAICWTLGYYYSCPVDVNECGANENGCLLTVSDPGEHPMPGSLCPTSTSPQTPPSTTHPCNCSPEKCKELTQKSAFCYCIQDDGQHTTSQHQVPSSGNCSELNVPCAICYNLGNQFYCNPETNPNQECENEGCSVISSAPPKGPEPGSICPASTTTASTLPSTTNSCRCNETKCQELSYNFCHCIKDDVARTESRPQLPSSGNCTELNAIECAFCYTVPFNYFCVSCEFDCVGKRGSPLELEVGPEPGSICPMSTSPTQLIATTDSCILFLTSFFF